MHKVSHQKRIQEDGTPAVSVILPAGNTVHPLKGTIESVLKQDFDAWELLVVCSRGISEDDAEVVRRYAEGDKRIRVIKDSASEPIGSLNTGISHAKGGYVALIAAGDVSDPRRLSTQFAYMEEKPTVGITQFYRRRVGGGETDSFHRPPKSAEVMKAKLLFFCDVCFSTVMIRKSVMEENGIWFEPEAQFPEHVFWFKMVQVTDFETIPLIYGAGPAGNDPFPVKDDAAAQKEMCEMAGRLVTEKLELEMPPEKWYLLGGRINIFSGMEKEEKEKALAELSDYMFELWKENLVPRYFPSPGMRNAIAMLWRWAKYDEPWEGEMKTRHIGDSLELPCPPEGNILSRYLVRKFGPRVKEYRRRRDLKNTEALAEMVRGASGE